jgi:hypothetical protein
VPQRVFILVLGGLAQRHFVNVEDPDTLAVFMQMENPEVGDHILADIREFVEGTGWRWTNEHPRLSFRLPRTKGWKFRMDFAFPAPNFQDTGPVTVSFLVNGRLLDKVRYTQPGDQHFEKAVPASWLRAGEENVAGADIDPPWIAPRDNVRLGIVLHAAGFVE